MQTKTSDTQNMNDKNIKESAKKYIWLIIFLFIMFASASTFNTGQSFSNLYTELKNQVISAIGIDNEGYTGPKTLLKQEVVQEESVVIDAVEKVSPSVVSVVVKTVAFDFFTGPSESESGIGTGFIVDPNGLIVTNSHVVDSIEGEYSVVLKDGSTYDVDEIHLDRTTDIAILEITARDLPVVDFGDSDELKVGQMAIAIGNALGRFQNTVTTGVVSGVGRELVASGGFGTPTTVYENAIQTDAALNPGNSGGPLLNSSGQVIGINVATTAGADNISFAIPVNVLKPLLESFIQEGKIIKPYIGIRYVMITEEIARLRDLPEGAFISQVVSGSPADKAGLKRGDIIVMANGVEVDSDNNVAKIISKARVGEVLEIKVDRDKEQLNFKLTLEEMPEEF